MKKYFQTRLTSALYLFFGVVVLGGLSFFASIASSPIVRAEEVIGGIANQADCAAAGGSWTTVTGGQAPVQQCSCPAGGVVLNGKCVSSQEASCETSGGTWETSYVGSELTSRCTNCPAGTLVSGWECKESSSSGSGGSTGSGIGSGLSVDEDGQKVFDIIQTGINLLTALASLAITGAVIVAGIQYSTAGGNPQAAAKAKGRIINAIIALGALVFLFAFFQWLVPGGIFE